MKVRRSAGMVRVVPGVGGIQCGRFGSGGDKIRKQRINGTEGCDTCWLLLSRSSRLATTVDYDNYNEKSMEDEEYKFREGGRSK